MISASSPYALHEILRLSLGRFPFRMRTLPPLLAAALLLLTPDLRAADPELKTATMSSVQYYLSLPKGWEASRTWPMMVTIDGSGHKFQQNIEAFMKARGELPFVIVTPCVNSNGKDPADLKAILEIMEEVRKAVNGQPKFFATGFSAGGHVAWQLILLHPELLAAGSPAASNFSARGVDEVSKAPERVKLPIHAFQGGKDSVKKYLDPQWEAALKLATENGYTNLTRTELPEAEHQAFAPQVVAFFASLLPK